MPISHLAADPAFTSAAAAAAAAALLFTLLISIRMTRRHRAYRLLNAGLALALMPAASAGWLPPPLSEALGLFSFVIINAAALELYTRLRRLDRLLFALLSLLPIGALALQQLPLSASAGELLPPGGLSLPAVHAAGALACLFLLTGVMPRIGQPLLYGGSVVLVLLLQLAKLAADLSGAAVPAALEVPIRVLPAGYGLLLFLFVLGGVADRLKHVYNSSIRDGLTGLYHRQHFLKKTERYRSRGFRVAILFCDIDDFKRLNDTEGHAAADEALKRVAGIVQEETRGIGSAGRYGGEELVASVAHPKAKPSAVAEAIRRRVEAETPVTVSIGWSAAVPGVPLAETLKQADEAMYKSKHGGKNKVTAHKAPRAAAGSGERDSGLRS